MSLFIIPKLGAQAQSFATTEPICVRTPLSAQIPVDWHYLPRSLAVSGSSPYSHFSGSSSKCMKLCSKCCIRTVCLGVLQLHFHAFDYALAHSCTSPYPRGFAKVRWAHIMLGLSTASQKWGSGLVVETVAGTGRSTAGTAARLHPRGAVGAGHGS